MSDGRIPDPAEKPTLTVAETAVLLGVSRGALYRDIASAGGDVRWSVIRVGARLVIPTAVVVRKLVASGVV